MFGREPWRVKEKSRRPNSEDKIALSRGTGRRDAAWFPGLNDRRPSIWRGPTFRDYKGERNANATLRNLFDLYRVELQPPIIERGASGLSGVN